VEYIYKYILHVGTEIEGITSHAFMREVEDVSSHHKIMDLLWMQKLFLKIGSHFSQMLMTPLMKESSILHSRSLGTQAC